MFSTLHPSWQSIVQEEWIKPYFQKLFSFLKEEGGKATIYPPSKEVLYAFHKTGLDQVKVVLLGQDPYHGAGQAHGLAFSVRKGIPLPPSLKNIYKELQADLKIPLPSYGCLESWAEQGVLLLNTLLTVREGFPGSHAGQGWEQFTDRCLTVLWEQKRPLIFLLWGKIAQKKFDSVIQKESSLHTVLRAAHPSPFSANNGFFGCKHFSKINEELTRQGVNPIDWRLP